MEISVVLLCYNQRTFVRDALQSIISQKFNGDWEVIIGDDCSVDNTLDVIRETIADSRIKFSLYSNKVNLGLTHNFEKAFLQAKGRYIAYLEGDDIWIDEFKLQKQFNFLEGNSYCVLAFHDFVTIDEKSNIISGKNLFKKSLQRNRSKRDMVTGCLIHQNTMMLRNVVREFPLGFFLSKNHDTFFIAYLSKWGEAGYVNCNPLHYRIHKGSLWSSLSGRKKHWNGLITYLIILFYVPPRYFGSLIWRIATKLKLILIHKS